MIDIEELSTLMVELDKLKSVYREAWLTDESRHENSAEHSWHLALILMSLDAELDLEIDMFKVIKMALVHDVCEIGAGDISVFSADRAQKAEDERSYIRRLDQGPMKITAEIAALWEEYEAQITLESRWVKVVDRALPFILNLSTAGKTWQARGIKRSQVIAINQTTKALAPDLYEWMLKKMDLAVGQGWLLPD